MENLNQKCNLVVLHRTLHSTIREHTLFSGTHGTFIKIIHVQSHETVKNFQRSDIIQNKFSNHSGMKIKISNIHLN